MIFSCITSLKHFVEIQRIVVNVGTMKTTRNDKFSVNKFSNSIVKT